jgi:hypothetical protein
MAIDLRPKRSGFAIFEGPRRLMDCGTVIVPSISRMEPAERLSEILKLSSPSTIVIKKERWQRFLSHPETEPMIAGLLDEAERHQIEIRLLPKAAMDSSYRNLGCETKAEVSAVLARLFPELVWQLPPIRRPWDTEHPRQSVFDAIALGFAFWQNSTEPITDSDKFEEDQD